MVGKMCYVKDTGMIFCDPKCLLLEMSLSHFRQAESLSALCWTAPQQRSLKR